MAKEIEILVPVLDSKKKALQILKMFYFVGIANVVDTYFYDPLRTNLKPDHLNRLNECFRVRKKGDKAVIVYKVDHFVANSDVWLYSDEYEYEVSDYKMAMESIKRLGLKPLVVIDSEKHIFRNEKYEIVFEDVKDLGLFLEVQSNHLSGTDSAIMGIKEGIRDFIGELGINVGKELNAGKAEIMINMRSMKE
ncbi:MAG: CYTH domain-containing protein [Candidatus Pacebacteria bacterium]|nr:CYTH domain-containing protein [Candidatus Paceibacterota bacterium]